MHHSNITMKTERIGKYMIKSTTEEDIQLAGVSEEELHRAKEEKVASYQLEHNINVLDEHKGKDEEATGESSGKAEQGTEDISKKISIAK